MSANVQFIFSFTQFLRNVCMVYSNSSCYSVCITPAPSALITLTPQMEDPSKSMLPSLPIKSMLKMSPLQAHPALSHRPSLSAYSIFYSYYLWTFSPNKNRNATRKGVFCLPDACFYFKHLEQGQTHTGA